MTMRALYLKPTGELGLVDEPRLAETTERHKFALTVTPAGVQGDPVAALAGNSQFSGLIIETYVGWVGRDHLALIRAVLAHRRRLWLYWPEENAVECVDREKLSSLWHHWWFIRAMQAMQPVQRYWRLALSVWRSTPKRQVPALVLRRLWRALRRGSDAPLQTAAALPTARPQIEVLDKLIAGARAVPFPPPAHSPDPGHRIPGYGAYLRTDFWSRIESGGSYGHTCYVARELAAVTERFVAFMAYRFRLLDDYGIQQVVLEAASATGAEDDIRKATAHYYAILKPAFETIRPAYIYERLCLGNYAGALLSQELRIPYIVEYNGSEISMKRSFDGGGYIYEEEYLRAEAFAFTQATMISVVSDEVKVTLSARGVNPDKILVNPNGADLAAYAPAVPEEKAVIRAEIGLPVDAVVVGFTGTFGGWHGVDVLADALPIVCQRAPAAHFLLIGDGNFKHLVDEAVKQHGLANRVHLAGRVPQAEGARLLKACDIYVSPHSSHMVDSRFFGSPTKIFEYMAMGGAIVASDLEQIGQTLSPALRVSDLLDPARTVRDERSILCTPGVVDEFAQAVIGIVRRPDLWEPLGRNARRAVEQHYSWQKHVSHLWPFLAGERDENRFASDLRRPVQVSAAPGVEAAPRIPAVMTGDAYKDEVQRQWDNDPAGSHYVTGIAKHTLDWFLEAEAYRYGGYAPWMNETMEFERHAGDRVLELGGGMGTDLAQFAKHGAVVTDLDLSSGHLALAKESFQLRGLKGEFVLHDAELLPFDDNTFDVVYSNGVIHHTPNTRMVVQEIHRVLRPGGRAIIMVYAENSLHYWRNLVWAIGIKEGQLQRYSMGDIMSRAVERSDNAAARPLVKVYTKKRLRHLFRDFSQMSIVQRQMVPAEVPRLLARVPVATLGEIMGWNLIIKARKAVN